MPNLIIKKELTKLEQVTVQRRRMISVASTQSTDNVHPAFSVAHFLKNQNERSVNAALTQGERGVNTQWIQNARRPRSVWFAGWTQSKRAAGIRSLTSNRFERRLGADQTRIERRPDKH